MRFNRHFRSFNEWKWCTIYDCHIFMVYEFLVVLLPLKKRKEKKEEGLLVVYLILTFQLRCIKLETCQNIIFENVGAPWNWAGVVVLTCRVHIMSTHEYSTISVNTNLIRLLNGSRFLDSNTTCLLNGLVMSNRLSNFIK